MKKLLTISVLAASLVSATAFAAPTKAMMAESNANNTPDVLLVAKNQASPSFLKLMTIAQDAINHATPGNHLLKADFLFDTNDNLKHGKLVLSQALQSNDHEAIQAAIAQGVRQAIGSDGAGWKFAKFVAGNSGSDIGTLYFISSKQGHDEVKGIAIHAERTEVDFKQVKADNAIVSELTDSKNHAPLVAVEKA